MRIIARRTLREFVDDLAGQKEQPAIKAALDARFDEASKASWASSADVKHLTRQRASSVPSGSALISRE